MHILFIFFSDYITYDPKYAPPLVTVLDRLRDVEDREGVILMTVRRFVETMLRDRLRCPSTVLERYIMGEPRQYGFISGK